MRDTKTILLEIAEAVKSGKAKDLLNPQLWINRAFELDILLMEEKNKYENLRQAVAKKRIEVYSKQEKKNISAAKMEIDATDEYRDMNIQEAVIYTIEELIRLSKKNAEINHI